MELRIGTTLDDRPAGFDTASTRPLVLVADPCRGKTWARFIARWWTAETTRHAHVFAAWPEEWADLRTHLNHITALTTPVATECSEGTCLVVVDDLEQAPGGAVGMLPLGRTPTVLTSCGGGLEDLERLAGGFTCLGLLRSRAGSADLDASVGQGRLDWPARTITVFPDQRGALDFPCHRWQTVAADIDVAIGVAR